MFKTIFYSQSPIAAENNENKSESKPSSFVDMFSRVSR